MYYRPTQSGDRYVESETLSVEELSLRRLASRIAELSPVRRWGNMNGPGIWSRHTFAGIYIRLFRVDHHDSMIGVSETVNYIADKMGLVCKQNT